MAIHTESFNQSQHMQFDQSEHLQRVCGMVKGIEYREIYYSKSVPGFGPIWPDENGTATGMDLALNQCRRYHGRTIDITVRNEGFEQDYYDPSVYVDGPWDSQQTIQTVDSQAPSTLIPTTTGGHTLDTFRPVAFTSSSLFYDGDTSTSYGFTGQTWSAKGCAASAWTLSSVFEDFRGDNTVYKRDATHYTVSETRDNEVSFATEIGAMFDALDAESFDDLWSTPISGGKYLNYKIQFDQWTHTPYTWPTWAEPQTGINPSLYTWTATGDQSTKDNLSAAVAMTDRFSIENTFVASGTAPDSIGVVGRRIQWRSNIPIDYCVIEFLGIHDAGSGPCYIHTECGHADGNQIVQVPDPLHFGFGKTTYDGTKEALTVRSNVVTFFGTTATQMIRYMLTAYGATWVPVE